MRAIGGLLMAFGVVVIALGLVRHESSFVLKSTAHASILIGAAGLVLLILGAAIMLVVQPHDSYRGY